MKVDNKKMSDKFTVPPFPENGAMILWINHLSKMTVANGGRTDQKEFAYLKECFKKPMDQLGLNAVVLDSKHKFYNTPMERERWRLVEIRLASALSAMLKNSIPPAHS